MVSEKTSMRVAELALKVPSACFYRRRKRSNTHT